MASQYYPFTLKPLPYAYNAMEPYIDTETMHLHHDKHMQAYVDNLNKALASYPDLQAWPLTRLIIETNRLPEAIRTAVRNNGGGVFNHELYFDSMSPRHGQTPGGALAKAINRDFGSYDNFKKQIKDAGLAQFGSGWAWLVFDDSCKLHVVRTPNQDTPLPASLTPLLPLDVWEHAYYLKYHNLRGDYIDNWFNVIDWDAVEARYTCG